MHYFKHAAVSGALALTVAASLLAGCGKHINGTAAAISVNGEEINVGTANFILRYQQASTSQLFQMYGLSDGTVLWDTDISGDDDEEEAASSASSEEAAEAASSASSEEAAEAESASAASSSSEASSEDEDKPQYKTYGEQFKAGILEDIERMVVMRQHMADFGFSITDEQQAKIDEVADAAYEANKEVAGKLGATEADVNQAVELMSYEYLMHDAMVEDMDREVSDEEAAQTSFTYARFSTTTDDEESGEKRDMTDDEKADVLKKANELIEKVQAEDDIAASDITALAKEIDEDCTSLQGSFGSDDEVYPDEVKEILKSLKDGELYGEAIETDGYYYVVRLDRAFDKELTESKKKTILSTRENDHIDEKVQEWMDASEFEATDAWNALTVTDSDPYVVKTETTGADTDAERSEDTEDSGSSEEESETDSAADSSADSSAED
ncbi:MAG: hypothetical protein IJ860_06925 [Eubacterium sp.]|nr:hypothetical protein [Eubacterium sp.]